MVDYVFARQEVNGPFGTGWFGPEVTTLKPRYLWGRYYFLLGAAQLAEADPTRTTKIVNAMYAFVNVAYNMLQAGEGLDDGGWGNARWHEFALSLQWYDGSPLLATSALILSSIGCSTTTPTAISNYSSI